MTKFKKGLLKEDQHIKPKTTKYNKQPKITASAGSLSKQKGKTK